MVLSSLGSEEQKIIQTIQALQDPENDVYLVGGAVRDIVLQRPCHDFDFVLKTGARKIARKVANALNGAFLMLDDDREIARVILRDAGDRRIFLDFSIFRAKDLEEDLRGRDFTINAMALNLANPQKIIDPLSGLEALRTKTLKTCSAESFSQDGLRTIRAIRMAVEFKLRMTQSTINDLREAVPLLASISVERIRDELFKIFEGNQVSTSIRLMEKFGFFPFIMPELDVIKDVTQSSPHEMDVWQHTLSVIDHLESLINLFSEEYSQDRGGNLTLGLASLKLGRYRPEIIAHFNLSLNPDRSRRGLLLLAALYHDIGKGSTLTFDKDGRRHFYTHEIISAERIQKKAWSMTLSNNEADYLKTVVEHHMRVHNLTIDEKEVSRRAIYRFFRDTGEAGIEICLLSLADILARKNGTPDMERWNKELSVCERLMDQYWKHSEETIHPPRYFDGHYLMEEFSLPPGPLVGEALEAVREAQACGEVLNQEMAVEFVKKWLIDKQVEKEKPGGQ